MAETALLDYLKALGNVGGLQDSGLLFFSLEIHETK